MGGTRFPALFRWVQHKFLHAPVQQFCDEEHILGWAGDLVNPAKLLQLFSGFAQNPEYPPVQTQFVDSPGKRICRIEYLFGSGRDAYCPRGARGLRARGVRGGFLANRRDRTCIIKRHVDRDLAKEFAIAVEYLDSSVATVGDVDVSLEIGG